MIDLFRHLSHRVLCGTKTATFSYLWILGIIGTSTICLMLGGATLLGNFPLDYFFGLDQAWRLQQNQSPYTDFITALGPLYYQLLTICQTLFGTEADKLRYFLVVPSLCILPLLLWMTRKRIPSKIAVLFCSFWAIRTLTPRFIDAPMGDSSFLAPYNTLAILLFCPIILCAFFPVRQDTRFQQILEGILLGILCIAILLLKMNIAVLAITLFCVLWNGNRVRFSWAIGIVSITLIILAYQPWFQAYLENIRLIAEANDWKSRLSQKTIAFLDMPLLLGMFTLGFLLLKKGEKRIVGLILFTIPWLVTWNNHENTPVLLVFFLLYAHQHLRFSASYLSGISQSLWQKIRFTATAFPWIIFTTGIALGDIGSLITYPVRCWIAPSLKIESSNFSLAKLKTNMVPAQEYMKHINGGIALIRHHGLQNTPILLADFVNIMPYILQSPSPHGNLAWMDEGRTFSLQHSPSNLLKKTHTVLIDKHSTHERTITTFIKIYSQILEHEFMLIEDTPDWRIYARRPLLPP